MFLIKTFENTENNLSKDIFFSIFGALFIALFAYVSIPLFFTPVPLALQPQVVLFLSILLGRRRASFAALSFLLLGAFSFPVFAGGIGGMSKLLGVTGGYLIGYVIAAYVAGLIYENFKEKTFWNTLFALLVGNLIILLSGMYVLSFFIGIHKAFTLGVLPFIAGDALKILLVLKGSQLLRNFKI